MKKNLLFFIATFAALAFFSCSEIPENNDPIIGIWSKASNQQSTNSKSEESKQEWIFNDAYLGRYHSYTNDNIAFLTDFSWTNEGDTYTISYPGTDMPNDIVRIKTKSNSVEKTEISENNELTYVLEETNGETLAIRE
tara:strand:+ start:1125 stop:1538 length:414 start_codon:yes stop_codon:yes gene_type:complete